MGAFQVGKIHVLNGFLHMGIRHYETYILGTKTRIESSLHIGSRIILFQQTQLICSFRIIQDPASGYNVASRGGSRGGTCPPTHGNFFQA